MNQTEKQILELFLPEGILEWFDVTSGEKTKEKVLISLIEKNIPPVTEKHRGKKVVCAGFTDIAVQDFPIRGRRVELVFRRRYWKVEGEVKYLKRNISLCSKGTQLEQEFGDFLKE
ncbi:MAG: hypothetical protein GY816_12130 [Cytophagales bacterium]|nr:hypothetical protein [Cytophagales bacterium]